MFGILLIYFIGKYFYQLSEDYNKNKWLHAILGVVIYYVGSFIGGVILGLIYVFMNDTEIMTSGTEILLSVLSVPFGLGAAWTFYYILKKNWEDDAITPDSDIY
ncbi:MAG: hypothetical protein CMO01_14595 [Thalassobius sp.]|nr:hypothetical protein [Thalassovita sp.]